MATHWREFHDKSVVHCDGVGGDGYTLCGDATEGENGDEPMEITRDLVRCKRCIAVIDFCKTVRAKEMRRT